MKKNDDDNLMLNFCYKKYKKNQKILKKDVQSEPSEHHRCLTQYKRTY